MNIPANNSLKAEIEEIVRLCEEAKAEYGEKSSYFEKGISEEEMYEWEEKNGVKIPESYKEWLRFSSNCQIRQTLATLYAPRYLQSEIVPNNLVLIGHLVGDGEVLCFSKENGRFVRYFEGRVNDEFDDFREMLKEIIRMLKGESVLSDEDIIKMLEKVREMRERGEL